MPARKALAPVALLLGLTLVALPFLPRHGPRAPVRILIPRGGTFEAVVDTLAAHDLIASRTLVRLVARLGRYDRRIQAGLYQVPPGLSIVATLRLLTAGDAVTSRFTVPEGFTLMDLARLAEARLAIPADSVLAVARDSAWLASQAIPGPTAEGFLRPDTYLLAPGAITGRELLETMAAAFREAWPPAWDSVARATGRTRLEILTLASLVEGEARTDGERPLIAGVYANRLRLGMALQADPTVQYALQLRTGRRKPRLFAKDYQIESPYNTYLQPGLPPGPVGAPSRRSIEAALEPARVPYLYFVAGPDGRHTFSRSYEEHLRAVARARRDR